MDLQVIRQEIETALVNRAATDQDFKTELTANPKKAIGETYGLRFGDNVRVVVHQESPDELHLVLPVQFRLSEGELSDQHLEAVAGGTAIVSSAADLNIASPSAGISIVNSTLSAPSITTGASPSVIDPSKPQPGALTNSSYVVGEFKTVTPKGVTVGTVNPALATNFATSPSSSK
jgi:hypothetical protein